MKVVKEEFLKQKPGFSTKACHGNLESEKYCKEIVPPISISTTSKQTEPGKHAAEYYRVGNPSRLLLESCLAAVEGSKHALCFSSGLSAATTLLFLLNSGDNIVCCDDVHGGIQRMFSKCAANMNITTTFVDPSEIETVEEAIQSSTKMIWIESPTDPMLKIVDIRRVAAVAQKYAGLILIVDNTCLTPYFQKPMELGADISVYSLSKYMNGHSDVMMGAICTNNDELHRRLQFLQKILGAVPSPFDCHLVSRGVKTLALRMEQHMKSALIIGRYLEGHPQVDRVLHPGLPSHPQHALLKRQCYGYGGVLAFYLKGGLKDSKKFISALKIISLAESFGACESLIEIPALMSHSLLAIDEKDKVGIPDGLIRLSVGLEDPDDLVQDIEQALSKL